ncbi:hypothetical protein WN55_01437 [Dufourea novaeangliae]|uniref:Uncharacterized protein n=1 Tax=Dufourea novaeangliae TaxID=178035 RepID=A0A154PER1_DUFNO|nr:hypothetical protein WN55_01437 [Dufourea novaeangliae]
MNHRPECRKYKQWKKEQAKMSKATDKTNKKKKKKEEREKKVADCVDEDEEDNGPLKINYRKCKKPKKTRRKSMKPSMYVLKRVSMSEIVVKKIQPPMEVRELLLNPRHTACLRSSSAETLVEVLDCARPSCIDSPKRSRKRRRRRKTAAKTTTKEDKSKQQEETEAASVKAKSKDNHASKSKRNGTVAGKRTKKKGKKSEKKMIGDSDSDEDSVCDSICSFDSEVCLADSQEYLANRTTVLSTTNDEEPAFDASDAPLQMPFFQQGKPNHTSENPLRPCTCPVVDLADRAVIR